HAVHANLPAYSVSKAAIRMLCQSMALEYAAWGIRVNEIAPGYVNAGLSRLVWAQNPNMQDKAASVVPLGKIIEADEVAQQVLWICSEKSKHITEVCNVLLSKMSIIRPYSLHLKSRLMGDKTSFGGHIGAAVRDITRPMGIKSRNWGAAAKD